MSRPKEAMADMMMKQMMAQMNAGQSSSPFAPPPSYGSSASAYSNTPAYDTTATASPPPPPPAQPISPFAPAGSTDPKQNGNQTPAKEAPPPPPPQQPSFFQDVSNSNSQKTQETVNDQDADAAVDYMFNMLKDPSMRQSFYQFLPENMRNPETLETMISSPMVKENFKKMMTPEMLQQIKVRETSCSENARICECSSLRVFGDKPACARSCV